MQKYVTCVLLLKFITKWGCGQTHDYISAQIFFNEHKSCPLIGVCQWR
jgi:hypothetical protein